jgi:hypothetical protein
MEIVLTGFEESMGAVSFSPAQAAKAAAAPSTQKFRANLWDSLNENVIELLLSSEGPKSCPLDGYVSPTISPYRAKPFGTSELIQSRHGG